VDARLSDGSRVHAIVPPLSLCGPVLNVRKFAVVPLTPADLLSRGAIGPRMVAFLAACLRGRANMVISGGTSSGKTTFLGALSGFVPHGERLVTIEDAAELRLAKPHVIALEARPPNVEGRGEVTVRDLVRNALRMLPLIESAGPFPGSRAVSGTCKRRRLHGPGAVPYRAHRRQSLRITESAHHDVERRPRWTLA
jgi:pilus assembly protein CpaF